MARLCVDNCLQRPDFRKALQAARTCLLPSWELDTNAAAVKAPVRVGPLLRVDEGRSTTGISQPAVLAMLDG